MPKTLFSGGLAEVNSATGANSWGGARLAGTRVCRRCPSSAPGTSPSATSAGASCPIKADTCWRPIGVSDHLPRVDKETQNPFLLRVVKTLETLAGFGIRASSYRSPTSVAEKSFCAERAAAIDASTRACLPYWR